MLLRLILAIMVLCFGLNTAHAKRVALVIGNGAYQSFTPLPNPVNDARLMEKALRDVGFEVTVVLDADQAAMKRAMLDFGRTLRKGVDASIFYYAGHGVQVKGKNYLIPIEASLEDEDEVGVQTVDVNDFLETMESAKSPVNIVVLDACRNNPLNATRGGGGGLAPVNAPRGSYIAYATAPGGVAEDGDGVNSPYTVALASVLTTPGLKLEDVFKKTREKVLASTDEQQVPWETSSITGDFYFKNVVETLPSTAPALVVNKAAEEWSLVQNSKSQTVLEAFKAKHGSDALYRGLAEEKLALLVPAKPVEPECTGVKTKVQGESTCLAIKETFTDCNGCPEMVVVPAGSFMMGSPAGEKDRFEDEGPQHKVTLRKAFAVGKFEVTVAQFNDFASDTNFGATACGREDDHPVACVSWDDAQLYVKWLSKKTGVGYRLLTEAEWEYANRAGSTKPFLTGDSITTAQANFSGVKAGTTAVGYYAANSFGLFDMAGNVWEWTEDCYGDRYKNASAIGKAIQSSSCLRVYRGGGWDSDSQNLRSAVRNGGTSVLRYIVLGFRLARTF